MTEFLYPDNIKTKMHLILRAYSYSLPTKAARLNTATETNTEIPVTIERENLLFTIRTYIPGGWGDSSSSKWSMEPVALIGNVRNFFTAKGATAAAKGLATAVAHHYVGKAIDQLPATVRNTVEATAGRRLTPNETKIFQGTDARSFALDLEMTPHTEGEADNIIEIVEALRFASVPEIKDNLFGIFNTYKYPPIFDIQVINPATKTAKSGTFVNYPMMALDSFGVKYSTGSDRFEHYHDGAPSSTNLSLQFSSLFPAFNKSGTWTGRKAGNHSQQNSGRADGSGGIR